MLNDGDGIDIAKSKPKELRTTKNDIADVNIAKLPKLWGSYNLVSNGADMKVINCAPLIPKDNLRIFLVVTLFGKNLFKEFLNELINIFLIN